jgi:hypothetical protein
MHDATSTSFKVSGSFRDQADFGVVEFWNADNVLEYYKIRYLPDFDFTGMDLSFDVQYSRGLRPLDSRLFDSIGTSKLQYIAQDGTTGAVPLKDHATYLSGTYTTAKGTLQATTAPGSYIEVWFQNFLYPGTDADALTDIRDYINGTDWTSVNPSTAIMASVTADTMTIKAARFGTVDTSGTAVTWRSGDKFSGLIPGMEFYISGTEYYKVDSVTDPEHLVLQTSAGAHSDDPYLGEQPGFEGNFISLYAVCFSATCDKNDIPLADGDSGAVWSVDLNFDDLAVDYPGIDTPRVLWMTLGPELADSASFDNHVSVVLGGSYDFEADFTNWTVTGGSRTLSFNDYTKGFRLCSDEKGLRYTGTWARVDGFYCRGSLQGTSISGSAVEYTYKASATHDLYVWTVVGASGGDWDVTIDGDSATTTSTLQAGQDITTRRLLRSGVSAGVHTVRLENHSGGSTWFDSVEIVVPRADVPDPVEMSEHSFATDYDTDATLRLPPQRLVWNFDRLGFTGDVNHYEGVFFWNERQKKAGTGNIACQVVTFGGSWTTGEGVFFEIGDETATTTIGKYVSYGTDGALIAKHFREFINETFVGVYATQATNVLTVCNRTPFFRFTVTNWTTDSGGGTIGVSGDLLQGSEGIWEVNTTTTPVITKGAKDWLDDYLGELQASGRTATVTFGFELLNPPDDPGISAIWSARYPDGVRVLTSTGFGQEAENRIVSIALGGIVPVELTVKAHGYETGDSINLRNRVGVVSDLGIPGISGTYTVTVTGADTFTLDGTDASLYAGMYDGDGVTTRNLRTSHLTFSTVVTDYVKQAYAEAAQAQIDAGMRARVQFGENTYWFFSRWPNVVLTGVTAGSPITITTASDHFATGQTVVLVGVSGITAANGRWVITRTGAGVYTLNSSIGVGTWVSGSGTVSGGGMALYDDDLTFSATAALGRPLADFWTQDDDPTVNSGADRDFLKERIFDYHSTVRTWVNGAVLGGTVEYQLLYPLDTNYPTTYGTPALPFAQGGRFNNAANWPNEYKTKAGSGLDSLLMECLSWGATYSNVTNAGACMRWPFTGGNTWDRASVEYLMPIFTKRTPRRAEFLEWGRTRIPTLKYWAWDHLSLFSWDLPVKTGGMVQ